MSSPIQNLQTRVQRSLERLGYKQFEVVDEGEGVITLNCPNMTPEDRSSIKVVARTVAGVDRVTLKTK